MKKFGALLLFIGVATAHILALGWVIHTPKPTVSKKTKITKINLSSVTIKKPVVIQPKPPKPIVKKPEHVKKKEILKKRKPKHVKKKKILKKRKLKHIKKKRKVREKKNKIEPKIVERKREIVEPIKEVKSEILEKPIIHKSTPKVDTANIKAIYTDKIRQSIQKNLIYPKIAKRLRHQGIVKISFRVMKSGKVENIKVINSPKSSLSKGAIKTIKSIKIEQIPKELNIDYMDITIPIEFKIK